MIFNQWLGSIEMDKNGKYTFIGFSRISLPSEANMSTGMMDEKIYQRQITKQGLADSFMVCSILFLIHGRTVKDQVGIVSPWRN
jgi:hypothetical protein